MSELFNLSFFEIHHIWPREVFGRFAALLGQSGIGLDKVGNKVALYSNADTVQKISAASDEVKATLRAAGGGFNQHDARGEGRRIHEGYNQFVVEGVARIAAVSAACGGHHRTSATGSRSADLAGPARYPSTAFASASAPITLISAPDGEGTAVIFQIPLPSMVAVWAVTLRRIELANATSDEVTRKLAPPGTGPTATSLRMVTLSRSIRCCRSASMSVLAQSVAGSDWSKATVSAIAAKPPCPGSVGVPDITVRVMVAWCSCADALAADNPTRAAQTNFSPFITISSASCEKTVVQTTGSTYDRNHAQRDHKLIRFGSGSPLGRESNAVPRGRSTKAPALRCLRTCGASPNARGRNGTDPTRSHFRRRSGRSISLCSDLSL